MGKIVLIHGTSVGVKFANFRDRKIVDGSFEAYRDLIESGEAKLFNWHTQNMDLSFWECLNPFSTIGIYLKEREFVQTPEACNNLYEFLEQEQPEIVISHSLGGQYLFNAVNKNGLPNSVKYLFFVASEAPRSIQLVNEDIRTKLINKNLTWLNYHCFYDTTLLASILLTGKIPTGVLGMKEKLVKNVFYWLHGPGDVHTSILRDEKLKMEVLSLVKN